MLMLVITMMKAQLSMLHLNIRSIANKCNDFEAYLDFLAQECGWQR